MIGGTATAGRRALRHDFPVPYRVWLAACVALNLALVALVLTGPTQPWALVVDAALLVALVGFLRAWRAQR